MKTPRVNDCGHPERKHKARGMCAYCYGAWLCRNSPLVAEKKRASTRKYGSLRRDWRRRYKAEYRAAHISRLRAYEAAYYAENKDRILKQKAEHYTANKDHINARRFELRAAKKSAKGLTQS